MHWRSYAAHAVAPGVRRPLAQRYETERAAAQSHFNDLCALLGQPTPLEADPRGEWYAFERGAAKTGGPTHGAQGWADVWKRGAFAWEYKKPGGDLKRAYEQLLQYREALENPPLLVVSDLRTLQAHTNITNTAKQVYTWTLDDLLGVCLIFLQSC